MISIGTDIGGLILENTLNKNTIGLNNSIERMTTGYKINSAKDDAAGYSIAVDLESKISSMLMVQQNTEQGIAMLQTAESALDNIMTLLQRLRDLAEQASNGVYGDDSRAAMQAEADQLIEQIEQIKNTTNFNGINLFEGPQPTTTHSRSVGLRNSNVKINIPNDSSGTAASTAAPAFTPTTFTSILDTVDEEIDNLSSSIKSNTQVTTYSTPAPRDADIQGVVEVAGNSTQVVNIDGVDYTVTNRLTTSQSFSYTKDTTTGEVTFLSSDFTIRSQSDVAQNVIITGFRNYFTIRGQSDVAHNIIINGRNNYVYGGDLDDKIQDVSSVIANYILLISMVKMEMILLNLIVRELLMAVMVMIFLKLIVIPRL